MQRIGEIIREQAERGRALAQKYMHLKPTTLPQLKKAMEKAGEYRLTYITLFEAMKMINR